MKNRLRILLAEKKMKISELSEELKVSRNTLTSYYYERCSMFRLNIVLKICDYFDCSLDYFFGRSEKRWVKKCSHITTWIYLLLFGTIKTYGTLVVKDGVSVGEAQAEADKLTNENAVILLDEYEQQIKAMYQALDEYDGELSGTDATIYDDLMEKLEQAQK